MAHLMKANRNQVGGLTRHFERYKKENGEYIKFGNQDIDTEKIKLNYNLAENKNQFEFIKKRTSEVRCLNRKNVNVMTSEKFKNMGKNYKKDTLAIRNTNIKLQRKVRNMKIDFYFDLEGSEKNRGFCM